MRLLTSQSKCVMPRHIAAAAEGIAAAQFARSGFDVEVQAASNRPLYDLCVSAADAMLQIRVRGSDNGYWAFADHYETRKSPDHHRAIDLWLQHHGTRIICCLVDFHSVDLSEMPSIYLASTVEVADKLHEVTTALGSPLIYEAFERRPETVDGHKLMWLPSEWSFSEARIRALAAHPRHLVERHEVFARQQWSGTH